MDAGIIIRRFQSIQVHLDITIDLRLYRSDITFIARCKILLSSQSATIGITFDSAAQQVHLCCVLGRLIGCVSPSPIFRFILFLLQVARVRIGSCTATIDIRLDGTAKDIDVHIALHIAGFTATKHTTLNLTATNNDIRPDVGSKLIGVVRNIFTGKCFCKETVARSTAAAINITINFSTIDYNLCIWMGLLGVWCCFLLIRRSHLWRTDRGHGTTAIDTTLYLTAINLNQRRAGHRARGIAALFFTIIVYEFTNTRTGTEYVTASASIIYCVSLFFYLTFVNLHLSTIAHMAVLSAAINWSIDGRTCIWTFIHLSLVADIDNSLIDIA